MHFDSTGKDLTVKDSEQVEILRFTRTIFRLGESQLLLNATINAPLDASTETYPELVENIEEIQESLYVNYFVIGDPTKEYVEYIKKVATTVFEMQSLSYINGTLT